MPMSQKVKSGTVKCVIKIGMSCCLAVALIFSPFSSVSYAADHDWTGFYGGLNIGGGFETNSHVSSFRDPDAIAVPLLRDTIDIYMDMGGVLGGLQVGYNHQIGKLVFGVEADFQGAGINGMGTGSDQNINTSLIAVIAEFIGEEAFLICELEPEICAITINYDREVMARSSLDAFGTLRGRLGYSSGSLLVYGTLGLIYGNVDNSIGAVDTLELCLISECIEEGQFDYARSKKEWKVGLVVGAGVEHSVTQNLSVKIEWLYYNLQNSHFNSPNLTLAGDGEGGEGGELDFLIPTELENTFTNNGNIVRIGLNWNFGN